MEDSFTVTSKVGWGGRIKNSFAGIIFGLILVAGSCLGLWVNEGRAVKRYEDLKYGEKNCVAIDSAALVADNQGKFVHLSGDATAGSTPSDPKFGIEAAGALKLKREVEMYQWKESSSTSTKKNVGGSETREKTYSYDTEWLSSPEKSADFEYPEGHKNPTSMRFPQHSDSGDPVTVGAFTLSDALLRKLNDYQPMTISSLDSIPEELRADAKLEDGHLYFGADPANPVVGDTRVKFSLVAAGPVSVLAEQGPGGSLVPHQAKHNTLAELMTGSHTADAMFAKAKSNNKMLTWLFRALGFIAMTIGLNLLVKPISVIADVLPFVGNIVGAGLGFIMALLAAVISFVIIAVAWLAYRPLIGGALLIGAALLIFLIVKKSRSKGQTSVGPPALDEAGAGGPPPLS
jgi:hypothetical protein